MRTKQQNCILRETSWLDLHIYIVQFWVMVELYRRLSISKIQLIYVQSKMSDLESIELDHLTQIEAEFNFFDILWFTTWTTVSRHT